jgi:hypothetical protein
MRGMKVDREKFFAISVRRRNLRPGGPSVSRNENGASVTYGHEAIFLIGSDGGEHGAGRN